MDLLTKLRAEYKKEEARFKELRDLLANKPDEFTDEHRTERDEIRGRLKNLAADIDTEIEAQELELRALDTGNAADLGDDLNGDLDSGIRIEDQPIYRGGSERALGAQINDAFLMMTKRGGGENIKRAETRYGDNRKREVSILEKETGFRAAGTGQVQGIASDGGIFLTGSTAVEFMDRGFNNSEVLKRTRRVTLGTGEAWAELIDVDETSRADGSRQGGIRVYTEAELGEYDSSKTRFQKIRIEPTKLTGLLYLSEEIDMNAPIVGQEVRRLFETDFAFVKQDQVIEGTGAGTAQGIMNADCKVSVPKKGGQLADTIVTENILAMISRFRPGNGGSPAWFYNRNCFEQLQTMTYDVGTGGVLAKLFVPPQDQSGIGSIWGWPAIPIEQAETLGDAGDIWLTDFSQYITADKGGILEAVSMHVQFIYGQIAIRFTSYFDGTPRDVAALTPYKGTATTSPFVRIAAR